jgi:hypothetical protein
LRHRQPPSCKQARRGEILAPPRRAAFPKEWYSSSQLAATETPSRAASRPVEESFIASPAGRITKALDVEPQDVVLGQTESADGCFIIDGAMRPVPVGGTPADAHAAARVSNIDGERRTPAPPRSTKFLSPPIRLWSRRRSHVLPVGAARHQNKIKRSRTQSASAARCGRPFMLGARKGTGGRQRQGLSQKPREPDLRRATH